MPQGQWADQQDPEQRIVELQRQVQEARHAAGRPPWPNAAGPPGFPPPSVPWGALAPTANRSRSRAPLLIGGLAVAVVIAAVSVAVFYLNQPSGSGSGGGPSPSASSGTGGGPSPAASAATPNLPTWTQRFSDNSYKAFGEVPIPGKQTVHLPAGQVAISFHAEVASGGDGPLSVPDLQLNIDPPAGVADPKVTESMGGTTSVDNDSRRRVWVAEIPQDGDYQITTDGQVGPFIWAWLAFGQAKDE